MALHVDLRDVHSTESYGTSVHGTHAFCHCLRLRAQTKCPGADQCISTYLMCSGTAECPDGSDEDPATCASFDCSTTGRVREEAPWGPS